MRMHLESTAPDVRTVRDSVPQALAETIAKSLANRREDRWSSAREMQLALGNSS
ncbi:MAG: hypothetical protein IH876_09935 [Gemmatimonadetes bacterium]|nr:hypothetical protein [Gemmatimonadota bacterium]